MSETKNQAPARTTSLEEIREELGLTLDLDAETVPFASRTDEPPVPGYDAWYERQLARAAEKRRSGRAIYIPFDEVAAQFGR